MKITTDNYEVWFLDYLEGNLNSEEIQGVSSFMTLHPELAEELDDFLPTLKPAEQLNFPGKEMLKRSVYDDPAHLETTSIAAMEGDLTHEEQLHFVNWLDKHSDHQKFKEELEKCRLQPNLEIVFPAKSLLKKKTIAIPAWISVAAAAAVLLVALLTFYPNDQENTSASYLTKINTLSDSQKKSVKIGNSEKSLTQLTSALSSNLKPKITRSNLSPVKPNKAPKTTLAEARQKVVIPSMESKSSLVETYIPDLTDLMPIKEMSPVYAASNEISLSDYLKSKMKELRASGPKEYYTREEVTIAGLRLFSRLPGNHLTAMKGSDGRLTTISFNTHLLAFSIPVNR